MSLNNDLNKIKYYLRRYGFLQTSKKVCRKIFHVKENRKSNLEQYKIWMENNKLTGYEVEKQKNTKFEKEPKISIVIPMYNTNIKYFAGLVNSIKDQTYSNWELCLADGSEKENSEYKKIIGNDDRIKYQFLNANYGISDNTNKAIEMVTGDYVAFVDHDDIISKDALYEIVKSINEENADFIYSDEDKIDENNERFEPYFKPDFSPETLECNNYITHLVCVSKELLDNVGVLDNNFNGAQDFDFVLRATEKARNISHISKILYHWRVHKSSTANVADTKPYAYEAGLRAVQAHLDRNYILGKAVDPHEVPGIYKISFRIINQPKVSIIIPNKDGIKYLRQIINSILEKTTYKNYEILIVENNSEEAETFEYYGELKKNRKIKILDYTKEIGNKEFNYSSLINFGIKKSDADYVLQLNNDMKLITPDWLEQFVGYCQKDNIGIVGAKLYYEDKSIQHAGIIVGLSGIAGNALVNLPFGRHAYFSREAAPRNVSAVTGACLFCKRSLYDELGYMDEENFKVAFNDVDFCLKAIEKGYRILYDPYVELYHFESKSRGYEYSKDQEERFKRECENFKRIWKDYLDKGDPYYNKNFTRLTCNYDINTNVEE